MRPRKRRVRHLPTPCRRSADTRRRATRASCSTAPGRGGPAPDQCTREASMPTSLLPRRLAPRFSPPFARELDRLDANIRRMFESPFRPLPDLFVDAPQPIGWVPPVEIAEDDTKLTLTAELPGI